MNKTSVRGLFESIVCVVILHPTERKVLTVKMKPSRDLLEELRSQLSDAEERHFPGMGYGASEGSDVAVHRCVRQKLGAEIDVLERFYLDDRKDIISEEEGGGTRHVAMWWYLARLRDGSSINIPMSDRNDIQPGSEMWSTLAEIVQHEEECGIKGVAWQRTPVDELWRSLPDTFDRLGYTAS